MADDPKSTADPATSGDSDDEAAGLRARIATLETELDKMRSEVARLNRETRQERRQGRRSSRSGSEVQDRIETIRDIGERIDGESRRAFRAVVHSQLEQMRLMADLMTSFANRIEREHPADDPDAERGFAQDVLDSWLDTVDRALDIPEKTIETFEETYKQAPRTRRSRESRSV